MDWPNTKEVQERLRNKEDNWIERKLENVSNFDIRKTMVGFANSVSHEQFAILLIGVEDNGKIKGVSNTDNTQKKFVKYLQSVIRILNISATCSPKKVRILSLSSFLGAPTARIFLEKPTFERVPKL